MFQWLKNLWCGKKVYCMNCKTKEATDVNLDNTEWYCGCCLEEIIENS